jgi:NADP-dependent 3-hydroxy acid dehydrogenase YdfG
MSEIPESIQAAVAKNHASSGRLDIVINNAGVGITGPLEYLKIKTLRHLFGLLKVMKAALPQMRTQKSGLIIDMGLPYRSIYSASGALELITEALAWK